MKTTRKQLVTFAIRLVKEIATQNKNIKVDYKNNYVNVWFHDDDESELISLYPFYSLKENKQLFKKAILKIRGE